MATTTVNQKVYVSPGVYTSETDLSFVAQSVGVTTLGLVGETIKGPAFEPVFITNYDEFQAFFGGTEPTKFVNTQIPKYEAAYIAKSYLQQSNQLFVTRVLGLSGYDAGPSWSISIIANPDPTTIGLNPSTGTTFSATFSGSTGGSTTWTGLPAIISNNFNSVYTLNNGSTSSFNQDFSDVIQTIYVTNSLSANTVGAWGSISSSDYTTLIGLGYNNIVNNFGVNNVNLANNDLSSDDNDAWFYANFDLTTGDSYSGYSFDWYVTNMITGASNTFSGSVTGSVYTYSGTAFSEWNNMVVATLRSRGISLYTNNSSSINHGPIYQVTGLTDVDLICTGQYSGVTQNPFALFAISGVTRDNATFQFETSLQSSSSEYMTKVLGIDNFGKPRTEVPLFVEEIYPGSLTYGYNLSYVRGLNCNLIALPGARPVSGVAATNSIAWKLQKYQSPKTPFLVSELRGNKVYNLFKFISISDGDAANTEVKISITNLDFNNLTFDVLVRNFFDTDANPVVIEKFTNCVMDPASNNFVAKKIGSSDGEYALLSRYVMIEMADNAPIDALPCGFNGYTQRVYDSTSNEAPYIVYKTRYFFPQEVIWNPPFGTTSGGVNSVNAPGDIIRRTYLGFSSYYGIDDSFLQYLGQQNPQIDWADTTESIPWNGLTKGFHMDSGATVVTIGNVYTTSGQTAFECGTASFTSNPTSQTNPYYFIYARKYTVCFAGGFDGWDIYRESRTNLDSFQLGASGYLAGAAPSVRYPNATGQGLFKRIVVQNNTQDFANTDYYAYLLGILTYQNPESTNINVFATASIDYVNNSNLCEEAIDMIQFARADSVYIVTTPDYDMFLPDSTDQLAIIYPQEAVDNLDNTGIDSNYTSTYYPWILTRDTVNNTQIYLPATGEVCRNLALTDNISFPWFATAGYTRGLVNSIKARVKLTQEDRDTLYQGRINPIATFADVGTVIWGNKTLQVADTALNRLNVRRLLLQARKLISAVAVRLLFEQNDQIVRQQFLDSVNPILDGIRRDRGLYDFRVTVSSSPEDLDRNTLTGKIYLKPTKALEFIDIEFFITPTGASFENI